MKSKIVVITTFYLLVNSLLNGGAENDSNKELRKIQQDLAKYFKIPKYKEMAIENFKAILDELQITDAAGRFFNKDRTLCGLCCFLVTELQQRAITVRVFGEALCQIYITFSTWTVSTFCKEVIEIHLPILTYIVQNSTILDPELACSVLLQNDQCYFKKEALMWKITVTPESEKKNPQITYNPRAKPLKILHLTDFHITTDYEVGGVSNCGFPLCCKEGVGNPIRLGKAGKWGDYKCDIPLWLFGNTVRHIFDTHKDIDLIYFTGDIIDHTVWKSSRKNNSELLYFTFKTLHDTFPNKTILPLLGNHESVPLNVFAPPDSNVEQAGLSTQWLYDLVSTLWRPWLPQKALETVKRQGYYSYMVNTKLKVIALNNNVCYNLNWWVLYNTTFLEEQLDFLREELKKSEQNNQFIHIIAHIPPGNKECIEPWETNFNSLVRRFSHIIKGQFYGHTHTDELKIFYSKDNKTPINVGYNGASLTPYRKFNPNYKIMTVDSNTYDILDIDTYIFNLTDANAHPDRTPAWFKYYSMKQAYNIDKFSPETFDRLAERMFKNNELFNLYWRFYVRDGDSSLKDGCDKDCKKEILCKIVTTESQAPSKSICN